MRATVETHGVEKMPPIRIVIADGEDNEDVVIKVSDEGGGIRRSNMNRIWSYLFTTADPKVLEVGTRPYKSVVHIVSSFIRACLSISRECSATLVKPKTLTRRRRWQGSDTACQFPGRRKPEPATTPRPTTLTLS